MNVNVFFLGGNLTRDPSLRYLPDGRAVADYTVACNQYAVDEGQTYERCDFFPVTSYGPQAENDAKYLRKGQEVLVECAVHSWYDEEKRRGGFNFEVKKAHYGAKAREHQERKSVEGPAEPPLVPDVAAAPASGRKRKASAE